ncbi:MAG: flagellar brake protein [Agarilytica sp.]
MSDEKIQFDELALSMGQSVEILPSSTGEKEFSEVLVLGAIPGEAIILGAPASGVFPKLSEGEKIVFRAKMADGLALFASNVLFMNDVPLFMVYIDFPKSIQFKRIRNATRVSVKMPILVSNTDNPKYNTITGRIEDISTLGAGLILSEFAGGEGDILALKGKFTVGKIQRVLSIRAVARKVKKLSDDAVFYGVEFLEEDENDLLVLFGFIFNAMAFGKIQKIP